MTEKSQPQLILELFARPAEAWTQQAACASVEFDMVFPSVEQMSTVCGRCPVVEECDASANKGQPIRAGARGNKWRGTKPQPQFSVDPLDEN